MHPNIPALRCSTTIHKIFNAMKMMFQDQSYIYAEKPIRELYTSFMKEIAEWSTNLIVETGTGETLVQQKLKYQELAIISTEMFRRIDVESFLRIFDGFMEYTTTHQKCDDISTYPLFKNMQYLCEIHLNGMAAMHTDKSILTKEFRFKDIPLDRLRIHLAAAYEKFIQGHNNENIHNKVFQIAATKLMSMLLDVGAYVLEIVNAIIGELARVCIHADEHSVAIFKIKVQHIDTAYAQFGMFYGEFSKRLSNLPENCKDVELIIEHYLSLKEEMYSNSMIAIDSIKRQLNYFD